MVTSSAPPSEIAQIADHEETLPAPTLADIAHIVFPHLAACTAVGESIECSVAELCILLAKTDIAGCYGPPSVAHDTLLNAIWASVAAAVPAGASAGPAGEGAALPSLYDAVRDDAPSRLLKKYLAASDLPFSSSAPHDVLLAATPKLTPPRLIALSRRARRSPQWKLVLLSARVHARGLELPRPEHLPEAVGVEEVAAGDLTYFTLTQLETFLVEFAFLRQHCDLEKILKEAMVQAVVEQAEWADVARLEKIENLVAEVPLQNIIDVHDVARVHALVHIIKKDQGGIDAVRRLPGLPSTLAAELKANEYNQGLALHEMTDAQFRGYLMRIRMRSLLAKGRHMQLKAQEAGRL